MKLTSSLLLVLLLVLGISAWSMPDEEPTFAAGFIPEQPFAATNEEPIPVNEVPEVPADPAVPLFPDEEPEKPAADIPKEEPPVNVFPKEQDPLVNVAPPVVPKEEPEKPFPFIPGFPGFPDIPTIPGVFPVPGGGNVGGGFIPPGVLPGTQPGGGEHHEPAPGGSHEHHEPAPEVPVVEPRPPVGEYGLTPGFYHERCPNLEGIVRKVMRQAVEREPRQAASILRLQFHDCFVQGCDGSILLDDTPTFRGEKSANPNLNSARGFEVIDQIKQAVEEECEGIVSCADILALAAREGVVLTEGPSWEVPLGRRDSLTASAAIANSDIPPPNSTLSQLVNAFGKKGLSAADMIVLSGSHTIGKARCASFTQRLYNFQNTRRPDPSIDPEYLRELRDICPRRGDAQIAAVLDFATPTRFDNRYWLDLQMRKVLLTSDQVLFSVNNPSPVALQSNALVSAFSADQDKFFRDFAAAMMKMSIINPLVGDAGQIRRNCRYVNK